MHKSQEAGDWIDWWLICLHTLDNKFMANNSVTLPLDENRMSINGTIPHTERGAWKCRRDWEWAVSFKQSSTTFGGQCSGLHRVKLSISALAIFISVVQIVKSWISLDLNTRFLANQMHFLALVCSQYHGNLRDRSLDYFMRCPSGTDQTLDTIEVPKKGRFILHTVQRRRCFSDDEINRKMWSTSVLIVWIPD